MSCGNKPQLIPEGVVVGGIVDGVFRIQPGAGVDLHLHNLCNFFHRVRCDHREDEALPGRPNPFCLAHSVKGFDSPLSVLLAAPVCKEDALWQPLRHLLSVSQPYKPLDSSGAGDIACVELQSKFGGGGVADTELLIQPCIHGVLHLMFRSVAHAVDVKQILYFSSSGPPQGFPEAAGCLCHITPQLW